jgi:membrane-associated phospholipid phosphatase
VACPAATAHTMTDRPGACRRTAGAVLAASATGFLVLTILVAAHMCDRVDLWARHLFRPHDEWGDLQIRVDLIVEGLKPRNAALFLALLVAGTALARRSWRVVLCTGLVAGLGAGLTLAAKVAVRRLDPHGELGGIGGSYPSGHILAVLLVAGCTLLVLRRRPGWRGWTVVGLVGAVMAWALLVQAAHWLTDVVGAVLLGIAILAGATLLPFQPAPHRRGAVRVRET